MSLSTVHANEREDERLPGVMGRLARFVLRHRRAVMLAWLAIFVAGVVGSGQLSNRLKVDFSLPGQPGYGDSPSGDRGGRPEVGCRGSIWFDAVATPSNQLTAGYYVPVWSRRINTQFERAQYAERHLDVRLRHHRPVDLDFCITLGERGNEQQGAQELAAHISPDVNSAAL